MILSNQPTLFLGHKHRMNQALNFCGRGEIPNKVSDLIKKEKCNKCNDYMSLTDKNVSMNGIRFDVKQKYISRLMILSNQNESGTKLLRKGRD